MDIRVFVIGKNTTDEEVAAIMEDYRKVLAVGKNVAFLIRKDALTYNKKVEYKNENTMVREEVIWHIA